MPRRTLSIGLFIIVVLFNGGLSAQNLPPLEKMLSERVLGNANAPITMIEYASLTCSHCAAFHTSTYNGIKKEYVETGKVKFIFRDFPLDRVALAAAMMARCLPEERYFSVIELLFSDQENWARGADPAGALANVGRLAGMSQSNFEACLKNRDVLQGIIKKRNEGQKKYRVESTPTFVIDGKPMAGGRPIAEFRKLLDAALAAKKS